MEHNAAISAALDERHRAANLAFAQRDVLAYQAIFSPSLVYERVDGTLMNRGQLMSDVAFQFHSLSETTSSYVCEKLTGSGDNVTETLSQTVTASATVFGILRRSWTVNRRGEYEWSKSSGVWLIERVKVLSEKVSPAGWRIGLRRT